jgi:hypothetical protein
MSKPVHTETQQILHAAVEATGRSQVRLAIDVLGVNDRSFRAWLAGEPAWPPVVRLAWLLAEHPKLADEIQKRFDPHAE